MRQVLYLIKLNGHRVQWSCSSIFVIVIIFSRIVLVFIEGGFSFLVVDLEFAFFAEAVELFSIINEFKQLIFAELSILVLFPYFWVQLLNHVVGNVEFLIFEISLTLFAIVVVLIIVRFDTLVVLVFAVQALQTGQRVEHLLPIVFYFTYFVSRQVQFNQVRNVFELLDLL